MLFCEACTFILHNCNFIVHVIKYFFACIGFYIPACAWLTVHNLLLYTAACTLSLDHTLCTAVVIKKQFDVMCLRLVHDV